MLVLQLLEQSSSTTGVSSAVAGAVLKPELPVFADGAGVVYVAGASTLAQKASPSITKRTWLSIDEVNVFNVVQFSQFVSFNLNF